MSVDWTWQPPARRRRWPYVAALLGALAVVVLGIAGGAARSTAEAADEAAQRRSHGDFAGAAAIYLQIATRASPLYVLARGTVSAAVVEEQQTLLAWARALAAANHLDQALRLTAAVTAPSLRAAAGSERASLLLQAAKSSAAAGDFGAALQHVQELQRVAAGTPFAAEAEALMPQYEVGQARALIAAGRGADAVLMLDGVAGLGSADKAAADEVLPAALLAAGREQIAALSYKEAAVSLQRLAKRFGGSSEARIARSLLARSQAVSGTLTDRKGSPISGQVRLSSNFRNLGGGYLTSGPFFYSSADVSGDFYIASVPQGGPYVLEVFHNGDWTTLIDPATGRPADPVTVTPLEPVDLTFIVLPA